MTVPMNPATLAADLRARVEAKNPNFAENIDDAMGWLFEAIAEAVIEEVEGEYGEGGGGGGGTSDHTALDNLAWGSSGHTGTAGTLAGFDGSGLPTTVAAPTEDHAALDSLAWSSSGHTGTAGKLAAFDGSGEATTADAFSGDHTDLSNLAWGSSAHTGSPNQLAAFDGSGNPTTVAPPSGLELEHGAVMSRISLGF